MTNPLRGTGPPPGRRNSQRRLRSSGRASSYGQRGSQGDGCPFSVILLTLRVAAVVALAALIRGRTRR